MENSLNDELLCSLKDELREVTAQINVHSEKLMDLLDRCGRSSRPDQADNLRLGRVCARRIGSRVRQPIKP